jgi:DNA/RNA-binding domain of Phe-tRNA-synthetase-like protein
MIDHGIKEDEEYKKRLKMEAKQKEEELKALEEIKKFRNYYKNLRIEKNKTKYVLHFIHKVSKGKYGSENKRLTRKW